MREWHKQACCTKVRSSSHVHRACSKCDAFCVIVGITGGSIEASAAQGQMPHFVRALELHVKTVSTISKPGNDWKLHQESLDNWSAVDVYAADDRYDDNEKPGRNTISLQYTAFGFFL